MKKIQWQDSLSIGIEPIDNQHKQWIQYFNDTTEAIASQKNRIQVTKTLGFLVDYTETHFSTEEKYMSGSNYTYFKEHQAKHNELRSTLANLVKEYEDEGITATLAEDINNLMGNWLIKHIQEIDMKFGAFVKEKNIVLP
jgi:hemerythrin